MKRKFVACMLAVLMLIACCSTVSAAKSDWKITKGFGAAKGTGAGLTMDEDSLVVGGYGEMVFNRKSVKEAVAVQFKINAFPAVTHYFYFGLMDAKDKVFEYAGTQAKGVSARLVVSGDGTTLTASGLNTRATGTTVVSRGTSTLKAVGATHVLVIYKESGTWKMVLDGVSVAGIPASSVALGKNSYLIAGAYSSSTMEMEIQDVFVDKEVTAEMKDGSYASQISGDAGQADVYYDDEGKLILGDTIITGGVDAPSYVAKQLVLTTAGWGKTLVPYLAVAAGITAVLSVVIFAADAKKKKTDRKEDPHEK